MIVMKIFRQNQPYNDIFEPLTVLSKPELTILTVIQVIINNSYVTISHSYESVYTFSFPVDLVDHITPWWALLVKAGNVVDIGLS